MLDHVTIGVGDFERSKAFYDRALKPLGIERLYADGETFAGYGSDKKAFFWIGVRDAVPTGVHVAFAAPDRPAVDAFHAAALAAGGRDNGSPGLRPRYHPNYYGAFILDPDGHNIEAVCRTGSDDDCRASESALYRPDGRKDMNKTTTIARMRCDDVLVRVNPDGSEAAITVEPPAPMEPAEIEAAAWRGRDARPFTLEELAKTRQVPRIKTLRRALRLTQEEFAARYHIPSGLSARSRRWISHM